MTRGCVIGWLDKNVGECSIACPVLYERTLNKLFDTSGAAANYTRVWPLKDTAYKRKRHGPEGVLEHLTAARILR